MGKKLGRGLRSLMQDIEPVRVEVGDGVVSEHLRADGGRSGGGVAGAGAAARVEVTSLPAAHNIAVSNVPAPVSPEAGERAGGAGGPGGLVPGGSGGALRFVAVGGAGGEGGVRPSPFQARRVFDGALLEGLAASIRQSGLMQPLLVRWVEDPAGGGEGWYELVAGERRLRAAALAGVDRVPVLVRELTDAQAAELGLLENVQRADLTAMERARGFRMLSERFGLTHAEIGDRMGLERSSVTNFIRLTELEPEIAALVDAGALGLGHARALLSLAEGAARVRMAMEAATGFWSVRRLERAIAALGEGGGGSGEGSGGAEGGEGAGSPGDAGRGAAAIADLEKRLGEHLGTRVRIRSRGGKGTMTVAFYSFDHFDDLMNRVGYRG